MLMMRGPAFLLFFAALAFVVSMAVRAFIAGLEAALPNDGRVRDPYEIAFLRGGTAELVRVVALALNLRGLLEVKGEQLRPSERAAFQPLTPIEREVMREARSAGRPAQIADSSGVKAIALLYQATLVKRGLVAGTEVRRRRIGPVLGGIAIVVSLAAAKIHVALATGHANIEFLLALTVICASLMMLNLSKRRTRAGDRALGDLRELFRALERRRPSLGSGAESDATLLAAVYGGVAGSGVNASTWRRMFTRQDGSSSGCGSSCGGGGGCGGGGCGGCGS